MFNNNEYNNFLVKKQKQFSGYVLQKEKTYKQTNYVRKNDKGYVFS